jgi:hypothetical protein
VERTDVLILSNQREDEIMSLDDLWTKSLLTVAAISLAVIAWKLPQSGGCGESRILPCYMSVVNAQEFLR